MENVWHRDLLELRRIAFDTNALIYLLEIRERDRLESPDAIIAATAMVEGCDAIIGNDQAMARRLRGIAYLCLDDYTM